MASAFFSRARCDILTGFFDRFAEPLTNVLFDGTKRFRATSLQKKKTDNVKLDIFRNY